MSASLSTVEACVFDAYGTLLDVHSAVARHRESVGDGHAALSSEWRRRQLEYTWLRSLMGAHADFESVTRDALRVSLEAAGLAPALLEPLMRAYRELSAFTEVKEVLAGLRAAGLRTAVLSNGTPAMLADGLQHAGIADALESVLSVETIGIYKPDPRVYTLALDALGLPAERIAFLSSNAWDAAGAAHFGFRTVWVNRYDQPREALPGSLAATLDSLHGLPALLGLD